MTHARNHQQFLNEPHFFHLMNRCVRHAYLCGKDRHTGKSFEYRKKWLKKRLFELAGEFFIDLYAYAIMSNHYHIVIRTCPDEMTRSSDREIARRWCKIFPRRNDSITNRINDICEDKIKITTYRQRLCDISWLMRCLNEGLARHANKDEGITGRFWQGRFRSQLLLDESAVFTCMAYVDLNPVRAGMVTKAESYRYSSIFHRVKHQDHNRPMSPISLSNHYLSLHLSDYIKVLEATEGYINKNDSKITFKEAQSVLTQLGLNISGFIYATKGLSRLFSRAIGSVDQLTRLSDKLELRWLKGKSVSRQIFL